MNPHDPIQERRRRGEELGVRGGEDGGGAEERVISEDCVEDGVQSDREGDESVRAQRSDHLPPLAVADLGREGALVRDAAGRGGRRRFEGGGDAVDGEGAVEEEIGVGDRDVVDGEGGGGGVALGDGEVLAGGEGLEAGARGFLEELRHGEGGGDGVEAEEAAHRGRREGEVGDGGVGDGEDGGLGAGEEEIRRDLEEGGGYVEAAAEAESGGGVEGEGVVVRESGGGGGGVFGGGDGDESEGERGGKVEGGVPPV